MVADDDGLPTRSAGNWTEEKLYFWNRYIDITTRAMVGHPHWPGGIIYVDLFAGPGVCRNRDTGKRFPGSVLIAANAPKPFHSIIACEKDAELSRACATRLRQVRADPRSRVFQGDCNERISDAVSLIPSGSLTLAFVDPEALHVEFDTIRKLADDRRVDLLLLFADRMDLLRNVERYAKQPHSNLDDMLGPDCNWRRRWRDLDNQSAQNVCNLFASLYIEQLERHLDYVAFGQKTMRSKHGPLYRLIFASKHPLGLEFWDKITQKDKQGQKNLF